MVTSRPSGSFEQVNSRGGALHGGGTTVAFHQNSGWAIQIRNFPPKDGRQGGKQEDPAKM